MGEQGVAGLTGPQGTMLALGATGALGAQSSWRVFRDYSFNSNSDDILRSDSFKAREIADYLDRNPSAHVAIDGYDTRRAMVIRGALLSAGVPDHKIQIGAFVEPQSRRSNNIVVLISN